MTDKEIIKEVYKRCPQNGSYTIDQYFDRCSDIMYLIQRLRPEIAEEVDRKEEDCKKRKIKLG